MNKEINWDEAPEGFDLHISLEDLSYFAKDMGCDTGELVNGFLICLEVPAKYGTITKRPQKEEPSLVDEDSLQGQLSGVGNVLHNLSCLMEDENHRDHLCQMATDLWYMSEIYKLTPEQKLRAKVWNTVAETDIRESDIDSITTDILEKFKLEEK